MRAFNKINEPISFIAWKQQETADWAPSYSILSGEPRRDLHKNLVLEQAGLCCYCGRAIQIENSHVEHFRPQGLYDNLALEYENLHASCIKQVERGVPLHCGHAKGSDFDEKKAVSPLDPTCDERFLYTGGGMVVARNEEDEGACYMISLLKLNNSLLKAGRMECLEGVFDEDFILNASNDDVNKLIAGFSRPNACGILPSFSHVIVGFAKGMLESRI